MDIGYAASINAAKTVITLNPTSTLADGDVYVAVTDGYYDANGQPGHHGERHVQGGHPVLEREPAAP